MKNKKGFTLVELLAVIAILSIIMIIAVPKVINQINNKKESLLETNKGLIIAAARNYVLDYNLDVPTSLSLSEMCNLEYLSCPIENPVNKNNMNGYVNIDANKIYSYSETDATYWAHPTLTVVLNGGTTTQTFAATYIEKNTLTLINPTKSGVTFINWTVSGTGSSINGNVLTFGTGNTTITANWTITTHTLTIDANGGTWGGISPQDLDPNTTVTISNPYRSGYVFNGWTVNGAGSSISGTTFTMGTANTTLTANWLIFSSMYTYTGSSTIIDDGSGNWRIKFLTSGTFTPLINMTIDAFLVGGGGGGRNGLANQNQGGGGGGGLTGTWASITLSNGVPYTVTIGNGGAGNGGTGGATSISGSGIVTMSKNGGTPSSIDYRYGGSGGSGGGGAGSGVGGSNGGNGSGGGGYPGTGQGTTTKEFGEDSGTLYAGAGGGGGFNVGVGGSGGAGGGGAGGGSTYSSSAYAGTSGTANTGGGGGGGGSSTTAGAAGASGGSGIVVIRNHR